MTEKRSIPPDEVLPCGCVLRCAVVEGINTLTYIPCRQSCVNYLIAVRLAADIGITPDYRR